MCAIKLVRELESLMQGDDRIRIAIGDHLLRVRNETSARKRSGMISPSQVGGCQQWALNQLRGIQPDHTMDPWMNPFFASANAIHDIYQNLGVQAGIFKEDSIEQWVMYKPLRIGGQIDAQATFDPYPIVDIKSVNNRYFDQVVNTGQPLAHHRKQIHCYMKAKGVDEALFFYVSRETPSKTREVPCKFDPAIWAEIEQWCTEVLTHLDAGTDFYDRDFRKTGCDTGCGYYGHNLKKFVRDEEKGDTHE